MVNRTSKQEDPLDKIMNLDYRKQENKEKINNILTKFKFLQGYKGKKVPQIEVENFIGMMCRKYQIGVQWVTMSFLPDEVNMFSASIICSDTHEWLGTVYGYCMLELLNKTAIKMFFDIKEKKIPRREEKKNEG